MIESKPNKARYPPPTHTHTHTHTHHHQMCGRDRFAPKTDYHANVIAALSNKKRTGPVCAVVPRARVVAINLVRKFGVGRLVQRAASIGVVDLAGAGGDVAVLGKPRRKRPTNTFIMAHNAESV